MLIAGPCVAWRRVVYVYYDVFDLSVVRACPTSDHPSRAADASNGLSGRAAVSW